MQRRNIHYYIALQQMLRQVEEAFKEGKMLTPFASVCGSNVRFKIITADNLPVSAVMGSFQNYTISEFLPIQIKRIGGAKEADFKSPIMTVYGMMMSGVVLVCEGVNQKTHVYTLNPTLAVSMCKDNATVTEVMKDIREKVDEVSKNSIKCIEIIPVKINNKWSFQCQSAVFKLRAASQTIAYAASILLMRNNIASKLKGNILNVTYYDAKSKTTKNLVTTLSQLTLAAIMNQETYSKIVSEVIDETKAMTLRLPELNDIHSSNMVDLFIPSIVEINSRPATILMRDKFNPYAKKKKVSGGDKKEAQAEQSDEE